MALYERVTDGNKPIDYVIFMEQSPYEIGSHGDVTFYEHPSHGDESPMIAVHHNTRRAATSHYWDMDSIEEDEL